MTRFEFEGDIKNLVDLQKKVVEDVLQNMGYQGGKIVVDPVGQKGDNYTASVKKFIYKTSDGSTFKMIGKVAPVAEELRMMMNTMLMFNAETIMYIQVLPKLNELQNIPGVTEDDKSRFPICYGVVTEAPFEFILLEDLTEAGFEMLDRLQPLNNECVRLVLKDLAIYHSLSYVWKNREPEGFKDVTKNLLNIWVLMDAEPGAKQFFESIENDIINLMDSAKCRKLINGTLSDISLLSKKLQNYEVGSKYSVVQQGDCWSNNILFRLQDGKPIQDVMIDYQLSRESNPVTDILYFIFNCTDHTTRLKHYHEWIDYYHEMLDDSLNNHGLKANRVFPKDQLDADLRRYGKWAVAVALLNCSILLRESKDVVDFKEMTGNKENIVEDMIAKMKTSTLNTATLIRLKEKIEGVLDTAVEFGLV